MQFCRAYVAGTLNNCRGFSCSMKCFLCRIWLVAVLCLSACKARSVVYVSILNPRSGRVVGGSVHFSLLVSISTKDGYHINEDYQGMTLYLLVNGVAVHEDHLRSSNFECTLLDPVLNPGWNMLGVRVANASITVSQAAVEVFMSDTAGSLVQSVLDSIAGRPRQPTDSHLSPASRSATIAFVGLGTDMVTQLVRLDAQKVVVLDVDRSACDVLGSAKVVRCIHRLHPLDVALEPYIDATIMSYDGITSIMALQASNSAAAATFESLLQVLLAKTRHSLWLIVPTNIHNTSEITMSGTTFQRVTLPQTSGIPIDSMNSMEDLMKATAESTVYMNHQAVYGYMVRTAADAVTDKTSLIRTTQLTEADIASSEECASREISVSRIVHSNWTLGSVHVHLQNACLLEDGRSVVVFTDTTAGGASSANSSTDWDGLLERIVADESNGFQFTPLYLRQVPLYSPRPSAGKVLTDTAEYLLRHATWQTGATAFPVSAQSGHIVHQIEALLQLLDCDKLHALPALQRLIFPALFASKTSDWIASVVGLILQYGAEECHTHADNESTATTSWRARTAVLMRNHLFNTSTDTSNETFYVLRRPSREKSATMPNTDFNEIPKAELSEDVCFRDFILLGRTNTHLRFFPTPDIGAKFRSFVHRKLRVGEQEPSKFFPNRDSGLYSAYMSVWQAAIAARNKHSPAQANNANIELKADSHTLPQLARAEHPLSCPPVSLNCTLHVLSMTSPSTAQPTADTAAVTTRHRKLKITISIRASSRLILNLPELQRAMVRTGLADEKWLFRHVVVLETLPFRQQVKIMSETDIFICVHGAAAINGIFMRPGSVVIEIFNARFVEFVFVAPLREVNVHYLYTHVRDQARDTRDCPGVPPACLTGSVYDASSIECVAIRSCSVIVDTDQFHLKFMEAYYHVLGAKWHNTRTASAQPEQAQLAVADNNSSASIVLNTTEVREKYIALAIAKDFAGALSHALSVREAQGFNAKDPVYLLEVGVMHYSLGQHAQAHEYCSEALRGAGLQKASAYLLVQVHVCLGAAGSYLAEMSSDGEHVVQAFLTAWKISRALHRTAGRVKEHKEAKHGTPQLHDDGISASPMMAVPQDSLEFNLLRAFERFGRHEMCLDWYLDHLRLPGLHKGGAHMIAYSIVQWSDHNRPKIDQLEEQLRGAGMLETSADTTLWDEIRRVQLEHLHSVGGASLCLNGLQRSPLTAARQSSRPPLDVPGMLRSVYDTAVSSAGAISNSPSSPTMLEVATSGSVNSSCGVALITQYYQHADSVKQADMDIALQQNLINAFVYQVYLLNEREFDFSVFAHSDKIYQFVIHKRLTFQYAFRFANDYLAHQTVVLANSDIFFDTTLHRVASCNTLQQRPNLRNKVLALQKWYGNRDNVHEMPRITLRTDTQDAWVFQPPMSLAVLQATDFYLGQPKCDNRLVHILLRANYTVSDPVFAVHAIELPYEMPSGVYDTKDAVAGEVSDLLLSDEMEFW